MKVKILKLSILFLLLFFSVKVKAQTIFGTVLNEQQEPLPGATVRISLHKIAISTDNNGEYVLSKIPKGKIEVIVSYVGFENQSKIISVGKSSKEELNFVLKSKTTQLSEVNILGEKRKKNITTISNKDLKRVQANSISDVFQLTPSVTIGGGVSNAQRTYLRGLEGSNLNITIDGARQGRELFQHNGGANNLTPALLKQVEVSTTPTAVNSAGALGGSIQFETIDAQDLSYRLGDISGSISSGFFGTSNGLFSNVVLGYKLNENLGLLVSASHTEHENYRTGNSQIVPFTAVENQNYFIKLSLLDKKAHQLRVSTSINRNSGDFVAGGPGSDFGAPSESDKPRVAYQLSKRSTTALDYRFLPDNDWVNLNVNAYYNHGKLEMEKFDINVTSEVSGGNIKNDFILNLNKLTNKFTVGADYVYETAKSKSSLAPTIQNNFSRNFGLYLQGVSKLSIISLSYGVRRDSYKSKYGSLSSLTGNKFSPNVGVTIEPITGVKLFGNYSESLRTSGTIPIQSLADIGQSTIINKGNPLRPETSVIKAIGASYEKIGLFTSNDYFSIEGQYFNTTLSDLIVDRVNQGPGFLLEVFNDEAGIVSKGFETSLKWRWKNIKTQLSYLNVDIENKNGDLVPATRRVSAPMANRFNFDILFQATSEFQVGYLLNTVGELNDGTITRDAYNLHNVQGLWSPKNIKGFTASVVVNNLLDKTYSEPTSFTFGNTILTERGRDIRVTLAYSF